MPRTLHTLETCRGLDRRDPLAAFADRFARAASGRIHFDANSMGAMPVSAPERIRRLMTECWRDKSRRAWTSEGWVERPRQLGADISHMIGAGPGDVVVCDNTTVNLFKVIAHAWKLRAGGDVILTESHNFPTDLHVAQGFVRLLNDLGVDARVRTAQTRERLLDRLDRDVAILYLSQTDYRSSERWDLAGMNERARAAGASRSGISPTPPARWTWTSRAPGRTSRSGAATSTCAAGRAAPRSCTWTRRTREAPGPPSPAGWVMRSGIGSSPSTSRTRERPGTSPAPRRSSRTRSSPRRPISGARFAGKTWPGKHESLTETLIALLDEECGALGVGIDSPRQYPHRGGHVSFSHPGAGPVSEALVDHGLLCSFRAPSSIRLAMSPLYHRHEDVWQAVRIIKDVLAREAWRDPKYQIVSI